VIASYDLQPGNGEGLFSREKISKEKSEQKRISVEAYDVNKQMISIVPKSTNQSRVQYSTEPTWGNCSVINKHSEQQQHATYWMDVGKSVLVRIKVGMQWVLTYKWLELETLRHSGNIMCKNAKYGTQRYYSNMVEGTEKNYDNITAESC